MVGTIISCIIDGTFVDMWNAIKSGDWAMLAMCAMAFVPGAKVVKGLKAVGGIGSLAKIGKKVPKVGAGAAEKRVAVIGEDMSRVKAYASKHGFETMPDLPLGNRMAANRAWINKCMDEGYTTHDLGPSVTRANYPYPTSNYYRMERFEMAYRNYFDSWVKL